LDTISKDYGGKYFMKNFFFVFLFAASALFFTACSGDDDGGDDNGVTVPTFKVTSSSINSSGRLLTATADTGGKQSPQLTWETVPDATHYAIFMVDESAGYWLHWRALITDATKTSLTQGETISGAQYKGPYPPSAHNYDHSYRIEVFALRQAPTDLTAIGNFDNENNYNAMVNQLNALDGGNNILGRGHTIGKYKNGDNNL
jgi:phosphatidylethanolamine-binding protein (PEBP) family uncharacterized protein